MSTNEELERRIDRLESRQAIGELATRYAVACDEHDMPALLALFTADAAFDAPNGGMVATGRDAIEALFIAMFKIRGPAYHWTHDVIVQLDAQNPDRATGRVYSHAETTPDNIVSLAAMKYDDTYRREAGRWLFCKRVISFLYYVPASEYGSGLNSALRVQMGGSRMAADYPESLPSWRAFIATHGKDGTR